MVYPIIINKYQSIPINEKSVDEIANRVFFEIFQNDYRNNKIVPQLIDVYKPKELENDFYKRFRGIKLDFFTILGVILLYWLIIPILIILFIVDSVKYWGKITPYNKELEEYRKKEIYAIENNLKVDLFLKQEKLDYEEYLKSHKKEFQEIRRLSYDFYKKGELEELFETVLKPEKSDIEIQKGISENYFYNKLNEYFDFISIKILSGYELGPYFPDIIISMDFGLFIDVEIDEPYEGFTKKVTHYYEPEENFYSDEKRNKFFNDNGWIVIRFSEKQIIEQPFSCCYEIAIIIKSILNIEIPEKKIPGKIIKEKMWSRKIANEMALFDYRNSYIRDELKTFF